MILGIEDPSVAIAYILMFLAAVGCVVYGAVNWNRGGDPTPEEADSERQWMREEIELDEEVAGGAE
jgi:hypothetical protein